ncbi:VCBS repeat-containing protein [Akkermansiaceae bacterium]|nr:VCBS repeat-containing protein [Akkermansiaceae bacterium]
MRGLFQAVLSLLFVSTSSLLADLNNELIPLTLKQMARPDRLPESVKDAALLTEVALDLGLPNSGASEGWPGEALSRITLSRLANLSNSKTAKEIQSFLAEGFVSTSLEPDKPADPLWDDITQRSGEGGIQTPTSPEALLKKIKALGKIKFKVIRVENRTTHLHVEADRAGAEYSATWLTSWTDTKPPKLKNLRVKNFKTIISEGPWFHDATNTVIGRNPRFKAQVLHGIDHWAQRITRIGDLSLTGHHGLAVGDVNGDGLEDLYVCDGGSLPNQLYLQQPDGTAKEVALDWGVAWLEDSRSALLVDLDNDGDQDLVVATIAMIAFAENLNNQAFKLRGGFPGAPYPFSLSAADFDLDGDLDIYTCIYGAGDQPKKRGFEANSPTPFNDAENGGRNVLLNNLGGFRFTDVTQKVGLDQNNTRWSFSASWEDYDRDGDPDLYVANDFGRNCLYRNNNGQFSNIAKKAGVEDMAAGMSVSWGDSNRDGAPDLLIGNMFSSAGQRVSFQRNYKVEKKRMARGNTLFTTSKDGFEDVSIASGITNSGWAWSSGFADLNNDGWQDLVVANGYLSNSRDHDL